MKIGVMNNPMRNLLREIQWIGENRFDFIDLTLEPPCALAADVDVETVRELLDKYGLETTGHTAYYLPIASPFPSFCELALEELRNCFEVFQMLGVQKVNLHPDGDSPFEHPASERLQSSCSVPATPVHRSLGMETQWAGNRQYALSPQVCIYRATL